MAETVVGGHFLSYELGTPLFRSTLDKSPNGCFYYRLLNLYDTLHTNIHCKPTSLKIHHETGMAHIALAWMTPLFELYCVAPVTTSRAALAQAANKILDWVRREEERVFIIGGAVF